MRCILVAVVSTLAAGSAHALDAGFQCMSVKDFADYQAGTETVKVNNFAIRERKALLNDKMSVVEISYSVSNRTDKPISVSGQFFGVDAQASPVIAMSAGVLMDMVGEGQTKAAQGDTYVTGGTLKQVDKICVRVVGDF